MAQIPRDELQIVMHGRGGDLDIGVCEHLPGFLEVRPQRAIRARNVDVV